MAVYGSSSSFTNQILLLGKRSFHALIIRSWTERLDHLVKGRQWSTLIDGLIARSWKNDRLMNDMIMIWKSELVTRKYCRDNVTMFSGHKVVCYCKITIFIVATQPRHRDLNIFRIFSCPRVSINVVALSLLRSYKNCRLPRSDENDMKITLRLLAELWIHIQVLRIRIQLFKSAVWLFISLLQLTPPPPPSSALPIGFLLPFYLNMLLKLIKLQLLTISMHLCGLFSFKFYLLDPDSEEKLNADPQPWLIDRLPPEDSIVDSLIVSSAHVVLGL